MPAQYVDPAVSLVKFEQQLEEYRQLSTEYEARGWFLVEARFPEAFVVMTAPQLRPPAVVVGVVLDYTNYDAEPPSVRLVNPFTCEPLLARQLPTRLNRAKPMETIKIPGLDGAVVQAKVAQPLMQAADGDEIPFLCIAGVREYHDHPGHSGDAWELHRSGGAGRLVRLLDVIYQYGVEPIRDYSVQLVPQIAFEFGDPPL